ncbi:MAG: hypothetical protein GJ680_05335 [Alteromonadaceae bacterium]|nr:hypothetical protein [Alteromonadaceae bacterium]
MFLVFICLSTQVIAEDAKTLVQEAKDYLKYKPATSLQILVDNKTIIETSAPQTKVDAYVTGLWAALYQDNNDVADHYASLLVKYSQADAFEQNLYPILAGMVSTLRKNEAYKDAEMFAVCMVASHYYLLQRKYSNSGVS